MKFYIASAFTIYYFVGILPFWCEKLWMRYINRMWSVFWFIEFNVQFRIAARFFFSLLHTERSLYFHLLCIAFAVVFALIPMFLFELTVSLSYIHSLLFIYLFFFLLQINLIILFDQSIQRQTKSTNK